MAQTKLAAYYEALTKKGDKHKFIDKVRSHTQVSYIGVVRWAKDYNRTTDPEHLKALSDASEIEIDELFNTVQ